MTYETQNKKVWEYLNKYGSITALEMFEEFCICHPPARIRDLRKQYGYDVIKDEWLIKKKKEIDEKGNEMTVTTRYKRYFLDKLGKVS